MSYYVADDNSWTTVSNSPDPPYIHVRDEAPELAFVGGPDASFLLEGATPRPGADTTHTVAAVDANLQAGSVLCALHVEANRLDVEDRRSSDGQTRCDDAPFEDFRAALDEIVIPVYLDDAVETLSDGVDGLVAIHTTQYDDRVDRTCTYFRTAVFKDETLLLEEERGSL